MTNNSGINHAENVDQNLNDNSANTSATLKKRSWQSKLIFLSAAFLGGVGATVYLFSHWQPAMLWISPAPATTEQPTAQKAAQIPTMPPLSNSNPSQNDAPPPAVVDTATSNLISSVESLRIRVDKLDARIEEVNKQTQAAIGDAGRAESLLVAFAARRALNRGQSLGYIEGLLQSRFGTTQPQAVTVILNAARQPITLEQLVGSLNTLKPDLLKLDNQQGWMSYIRQFFSNLFVMHRRGEVSTMPSDQFEEAMRFLNNGNVDGAIADVSKLPGHRHAQNWLVAAKRYVIARNALDILENTALLSADLPGIADKTTENTADSTQNSERPSVPSQDNAHS
ncbi:MAG: hypothetical protein ABF461_03305 [Zymomonas mobilis subsp. pomaceae]|uniref:Inner membrane protein n=1 Tax=Zymomonas mobilis subsp. pomaceae (strain ATCC 29192 / DSM 22645 / JCM 10191 / CCUG 17912 / NBRC 13757 / NCIMB 11200 / NRRL B-4491 / Barker I) TaxID=579138 RepID=F8EU94_ZYMMT|nr:hypothetical protein [Zymomonas mobilis]AEI38115.1 hypothetical protein Zymop_1220 [Zymomonas mobilis subsp. pomaceae ATCC 29192]MDX5949481.1 hypothetical protein [Zymomonas mobilis subsp. pomaceae]GEB89224.1 hypothetical protein ZMO02_08610 [Zymomonas mobilis subsp. pomaceae]